MKQVRKLGEAKEGSDISKKRKREQSTLGRSIGRENICTYN